MLPKAALAKVFFRQHWNNGTEKFSNVINDQLRQMPKIWRPKAGKVANAAEGGISESDSSSNETAAQKSWPFSSLISSGRSPEIWRSKAEKVANAAEGGIGESVLSNNETTVQKNLIFFITDYLRPKAKKVANAAEGGIGECFF